MSIPLTLFDMSVRCGATANCSYATPAWSGSWDELERRKVSMASRACSPDACVRLRRASRRNSSVFQGAGQDAAEGEPALAVAQ